MYIQNRKMFSEIFVENRMLAQKLLHFWCDWFSETRKIFDQWFLSTWYYLKCECQNQSNSSITYENHFRVTKSSENVNGAVYNVHTKFEMEITSLKPSKTKTQKIEQFFCLNPGFRSTQSPSKLPGLPKNQSHQKHCIFLLGRIFSQKFGNPL